MVITAGASTVLELHLEDVVITDDGLHVFCNTNAETVPQADQLTATLGNMPLSVNDVTVFSDTDEGVTYLFLVDVSGSIRTSHFQAIKDIINSICDELSDNDNVGIFAFGTETYTQPFVSDPDDIAGQLDFIDSINRRQEHTSLYESVFTSLSVLNSSAEVRDKRVLIIFSDGDEYIFHGMTIEEAEIRIRDSRVPIYTIATLGRHPSSRYVESAKILGSFARISAGGRHYVHNLDREMSDEIAEDIIDSIQNSLIVSLGLNGFRSDGENMILRLELDIPDVGKASDGYAISTVGLTVPEPEPESTPQPTPSPLPEVTPEPEHEEEILFFQKYFLWIIVGGGVLLVIIGLVLFLILRKKSANAPKPSSAHDSASLLPNTKSPSEDGMSAVPMSAALKSPPGKPVISLRLTKIGLVEEQVFKADFTGELIIGRDPAKVSLPFKDDSKLSARHCSISYEQDGIILRDLGSTNKTFVNGVPILDKYTLENDDVILIGSMELRVNWNTL